MPAINSFQDIVKGVDFTVVNPQTASEHNQLVELSNPYTEDANSLTGVSFNLVTTDTALNAPDVPNPETSTSYNKWRRYQWCRRIWIDGTQFVPAIYMWCPTMAANITLLRWQLVDLASQTGTNTNFNTPLQAALTSANTNAANAVAASTAAGTQVTNLATAVFGANAYTGGGSVVGGSNLWDEFVVVKNNQTADETHIGNINTVLSGNISDPTFQGGGINQQIAALNAAIGTTGSGSKLVGNLTPGTKAGMLIRTSYGASGPGAPEWFDPISANDFITDVSGTIVGAAHLTQTGNAITATIFSATLFSGWWEITCIMAGQVNLAGTDKLGGLWLQAVIGAATVVGPKALSNTPGSVILLAPFTLMVTGLVLVQATGVLTVSLKATTTGNPDVYTSGTVNFVAKRLSVATT